MGNTNQTAIDEYLLNDIVTDNQIYTEFFTPFVLVRLLSTAKTFEGSNEFVGRNSDFDCDV